MTTISTALNIPSQMLHMDASSTHVAATELAARKFNTTILAMQNNLKPFIVSLYQNIYGHLHVEEILKIIKGQKKIHKILTEEEVRVLEKKLSIVVNFDYIPITGYRDINVLRESGYISRKRAGTLVLKMMGLPEEFLMTDAEYEKEKEREQSLSQTQQENKSSLGLEQPKKEKKEKEGADIEKKERIKERKRRKLDTSLQE